MLPTPLCGIFLKDSTIFKIVFTAVIQSVDAPIKVKSLAIEASKTTQNNIIHSLITVYINNIRIKNLIITSLK